MQKFYKVYHQIKDLVGFEYVDSIPFDFYIADFITGDTYPTETDDVDPFTLVDKLYDWYIVNFASEGDPRVKGFGFYPAFSQIHKYAKLHSIPLEKILLFSSNLLEQESYDRFCNENNIEQKIKIFIWSPLMYRLSAYDHSVSRSKIENLFLCLNNGVPKNHRSYLTYLIHKHNLTDQTALSTYKIPINHLHQHNIQKKYIKHFKCLKPVLFESEGNQAFSCPKKHVESSLISIVNETHYDHFGRNMIDITEKVFKPMLWKQPLVIFGAPNANSNISLLGFKTYEALFNLEFDAVSYWVDRYNQGVEILSVLSKELSTDGKLNSWLAQGQDIVEHNYNLVVNNTYNKSVLKEFLNYINGRP